MNESTVSPTLNREIVALALPAFGYLVVEPLVSLCDTAFIGHLGAAPLAALGIAAQIFSTTFIIGNFLTHESNALIAASEAAGNRRLSELITGRIFINAWGISLLIGPAVVLLVEPLVALFGATPEVAELAGDYVRIRALSAPAVFTMIAAHGVFRGLQDTKTLFVASLLLNAINLVGDPLLIFGFDMGIRGAAWATLIAQYAGALFVLQRSRKVLGWRFHGDTWKPRALLSLLRSGGVLTIRTGLLLLTLALSTALAGRLGTGPLAAHQIAMQLWFFSALALDALAVAGQSLVAKFVATGEERRAAHTTDRLLLWGTLAGVIIGVVLFAGRGLLPRIFTSEPEVLQLAAGALTVVALSQIVGALAFVWDGYFLGRRAFSFLALAMLIASACGAAALLWVFNRGGGLTELWWAIMIFLSVRALLQAVAYWRLRNRAMAI